MIQISLPRLEEKDYFNVGAIQALDPLDADAKLARLPDINRSGDTAELVQLLQYLAERIDNIAITAPEVAFAAMRDVGIVLGSLKRHRIEPVQVVPEIEQPLLQLGAATNMVPRDTVHHYTSWNPAGIRRRMYTGDDQERCLQDAVVQVFPGLSASLSISDVLSAMPIRDVRFGPTVNMLCEASRSMIEAIDAVTARVSPVFFAQILRPYFEDITVGGVNYLGPAAAQAPLWLIDLCVWAADRNQPAYHHFLLESVQYSLPPWREFFCRHASRSSLVTRISDALDAAAGEPEANLLQGAQSLANLLHLLKVFRGRHIGIARRAYADDVSLYDQGSGGAPVALLKTILDLTRENEKLMRVRPGNDKDGYAEPSAKVA